MTIDKIKYELTPGIFDQINTLNKGELVQRRAALLSDMELIKLPGFFKGNANDLYRIRKIELDYIEYKLS